MQTVNQLLQVKGSQIFSVAPTDSVLRAIEIMATRHVGALLVMQEGTLLGIISERDYARKVILKNRSSHDTPVSDIMSSPAVSVTGAGMPVVWLALELIAGFVPAPSAVNRSPVGATNFIS